jgi:hypothetical protein
MSSGLSRSWGRSDPSLHPDQSPAPLRRSRAGCHALDWMKRADTARRPKLARLGACASGVPKSAEADALERIVNPDLKAAFRQIPPPPRFAVYLADVEGLSYREIAETAGTPCGHGDVAHPQGTPAAPLAAAAVHARAAHSVTARHRRGGSQASAAGPLTSQSRQHGKARRMPGASHMSKYAGNPLREIPGCAHGERKDSDFA